MLINKGTIVTVVLERKGAISVIDGHNKCDYTFHFVEIIRV